jgi:hypothetical protein
VPTGLTLMLAGILMAPSIGVIVAAVTLVAGLAVLLRYRRSVRQTTLTAAWWWTLAALVGWSGVELAAAGSRLSPQWWAPLRFAAASLSFCPAVSLIGAKRPQHVAWNFVVLSLWGIVALPAAEAFFLHPGESPSLGAVRGWFLWILILLGPINFLPTRFWLASLLVAAGQVLALSPYLALVRQPLVSHSALLGLALCGLAMVAAALAARRRSIATNPYDRLWLDFRDHFGLFWSLRVQERINAAASQSAWPFELTWTGFRNRQTAAPLPQIDPALEPALRTTFKGLLRRFVSHEWIAQRELQGMTANQH